MSSQGRSFVLPMALVALGAAVIDQASKAIVLATLEPGVPTPVLGDWFRFYLLFNPGAAFSMGENMTWLFTVVQIVFVVGIAIFSPRVRDRWQAVGLALVAGGALGNLIDRLFRAPAFFIGHVVDFISVGNFAIFNIADSCITVGVVIFILGVFMEEQHQHKAKNAQADQHEGEAA